MVNVVLGCLDDINIACELSIVVKGRVVRLDLNKFK